jgi:serine/threonine protein kinase
VPRVVRVFDRRAFAMSRLDAEPYRGHQLALDEWRAFFEDMRRLVEAMHSRGVAHCDLRSPDNTLITSSGKPAVVDFVASYTRGSALKPWSRWLFAKLCAVDRSAVDKQIRTVCPELLSKGAGAVREAESVLDRFGRRLGVAVRNLARRLFTDR